MKHLATALHALAVLAFASAGDAQDPAAQGTEPPLQPKGEPKVEIQRLEAWPTLKGKALEALRTDVERLRKARTPEMAEQAQATLAATGAAAAPDLIAVLGKEQDPGALARVESVLERVTGAEHTRLLAGEFAAKAGPVRTWCLKRAARFPDAGVRSPAEAALDRVTKLGEKADREERYAAALCATSAGSLRGVDVLASWAVEGWGKRGEEMRFALEAVRGPEASGIVFPLIASEERQKIVGGLHMLAGCGDPAAAERVRPFLDSDDNSIRVAAINAMRGIVDGEPPIANLPVFEAIELAKQWKSR